ncbi:MAG: AsmA family protein, partial [Burkholderiales bacterium]
MKWTGSAAAILAVAIVVVVAFFDWNSLKGFVSDQVSEATGRPFAVHGDLEVDLSLTPRITAHQITLANAPWGSKPEMLDVERLEFSLQLLELLRGRVVLPEIKVLQPRLLLEKNQEGAGNWKLKTQTEIEPAERTEFPKVGLLTLKEGKLTYRDRIAGTDLTMDLSTALGAAKEQTVQLKGQGRFEGEKLMLQLQGGSLLTLWDKDKPYPIDFKARIGDARATAKGIFAEPLQLEGPKLTLSLQGPDLSKLFPLLGVALPETPPYRLAGHLIRRGETWIFNDFKGTVGDSDLAGDIAFTSRGKRPYLEGDLVSRKLDFADLAGFIGAEPPDQRKKATSQKQKRQAKESAPRPRVFPDEPYDLKALRAGDAKVKFHGQEIITPKLPIDNLSANLQLENGKLILKPLNFGIGIGKITANITLDAQEQDTLLTIADIQINRVQLKRLLANTRFSTRSAGEFVGSANLSTTGNSLAELLGAADGGITAVMGGGRISNLVMELIGMDVAESLGFLLTKDQSIPIRCIVSDFIVSRGQMRTKILVIDTTDTNVIGEGQINLS